MPQKPDDQSLRRSARNIGEDGKLGNAIIAFLRDPEVLAQLITAADEGRIPASVVSDRLLEKFGEEALAPHTVHRFIGTAIRTVLEEAGFQVDLTGVRTPRDSLFTTAATFKRRTVGVEPAADSIIKRFVASLTPEERERAQFYIEQMRGDGDK